MFWAVCNLILSLIEIPAIWALEFLFMKENNWTVKRKKGWYAAGFVSDCVLLYLAFWLLAQGWLSIWVMLGLTALTSLMLFHRLLQDVMLDMLFSVFVFLSMELGIFAMNLCAGFLPAQNYAQTGCWYMLAKLAIMLPLGWAVIRWRKALPEEELSFRQAASVFVLPGFSVFFLYSLLDMALVYVQLSGAWLLILNCVALIGLNVYFLYLFGYLGKNKRLEQQLEVMRAQSEIQYRYYQELEHKYRESRNVFHDMKNHLQAVERLYGEKDWQAGEEYAQELYHMMNLYGEQFYSQNRMLNIILNEKLSEARRNRIRAEAQIGDVDFSDVKDADITTIFANLLDNAIEAAKDCPDGWMNIKIDEVQQFRVILLQNSRTEETTNENDRAKDEKNRRGKVGAKKGRSAHMGLGLINVRRALEQYHGTLELDRTEKEFRVSVMIPKGDG